MLLFIRRYFQLCQVFVFLENLYGQLHLQIKQNSWGTRLNETLEGPALGRFTGQDGLSLDLLTVFSSMLVPFFAGHPFARQVILTKSDSVEGLLSLVHNGHPFEPGRQTGSRQFAAKLRHNSSTNGHTCLQVTVIAKENRRRRRDSKRFNG